MESRLIVIEGLDGSGKATQSRLLADNLTDSGKNAMRITFPNYQSSSSELVKIYLSGELGGLDEVNVYAASSFYSADRYISYQTGWKKQYLAGHTIVADRYTTSNAVHQMARLDKNLWSSYIDWLWDFEFTRMGLPAPDTVIYLDMDPEVSRELLEKRYQDSGQERDLHEENFAYLCSCREAALYAAKKLGWIILPCSGGGKPFPIEKIAEDIINLL